MKLKSFGCSFIYGSDLSDCPHGVNEHHPPPSRLVWPALLADLHDLEYECHARPAAGNLQILEILLSTIDQSEHSLYVINWTWIERFCLTRDTEKSGNKPWNPNGWCAILPSDKDEVAKIYYQHMHSQFRDKLETLICIKTAIDILSANDVKFIMTYTDDLIFETQWHTSPAIRYLQNDILPYVSHFNGQSYWNWVKSNGFAISDKWHPLEKAHESAAGIMRPAIDAILHKV